MAILGFQKGVALMIGETVSHYKVIGKLGEGGMGEVYLAEDTSLDRKVALKFLPQVLQGDELAHRRFLREAKSAAGLDHPFICNIYEVSRTDDEVDFIVMEYVEGLTLQEKLTEGPLALKEALGITKEVTEALEKAHNAGIVHRDLKPANIMITPDGHAKVMDFGLAKKVVQEDGTEQDISSALTRAGSTLGTLPYMSPEQLEGKAVDSRSDLFSLGVVLYELVTGIHPFRKETIAGTAGAIITQEPSKLSHYREGIPDLLEHTLAKMLAKDPERRYQTIHEVRTNLAQLIEETGPQTLVGPLAGFRWMTPTLIGLGLLLMVAIALIIILQPTSNSPIPFKAVTVTSYPGFEGWPSLSPDGRNVAFTWSGGTGQNIYVKSLDEEAPHPLTYTTNLNRAAAWSPDYKNIAFIRIKKRGEQRASVHLISPFGGKEREVAEISTSTRTIFTRPRLAWSPDSKRLVVNHRETPEEGPGLFLLSIESGEMRRLTQPPPGSYGDYGQAFSPNGETLAFVRASTGAVGDLYLLNLSDDLAPVGEPERWTHLHRHMTDPAWAADGEEIILSVGSHWLSTRLWRVRSSGTADPKPILLLGEDIWDPAISREGNRLVYSQRHMVADVYRLELDLSRSKASPSAKVFSSSRFDFVPTYSPDGERAVFSSSRSGSFEIWVCDREGENPRRLTSYGEGYAVSPSWSPDGDAVAFHYHRFGSPDIYVVGAQGGEPRQLTTDPAHDSSARWSRDGKWIHFRSDRTGRTENWKVPVTGGAAIPDPYRRGYESPDGKTLYFLRTGSIWGLSSENGEETEILPGVQSIVGVVEDGIFYARHGPEYISEINFYFYDFETGEDRQFASVRGSPWLGFRVSPDGRSILYGMQDMTADLMLVEDFR